MYVSILAFAIAVVVLVLEIIILAVFWRKKSWKFHVPAIIATLVFFWPTTQLIFGVILYINTEEGTFKNPNEAPKYWGIPEACGPVSYFSDPTGRWFGCSISEEEANLWLSENGFKTKEAVGCGAFKLKAEYANEALHKFATPMTENGAGKSAWVVDGQLTTCHWYW